MKKVDIEEEYNREYDIEYRTGFLAGYNFNIMIEDLGDVIELDAESLYSLGYHDGQNYAEYCKIAGLAKDLKQENLEAQIGRAYSKSFSKFKDYQHKYSDYREGFLSGKYEFLQKVIRNDVNISPVLEVNEEDYNSLGFYDGYVSSLETDNQVVGRIDDNGLEPIIRESFKSRKKIQEKGIESSK